MSQAATFDEITVEVERASAFASLAKTTTNVAMGFVLFHLVSSGLDTLMKTLTQDHIDRLTLEQSEELKTSLQSLHSTLRRIHKIGAPPRIMQRTANHIWDRAEDLSDLIEVLMLRENSEVGIV